MPPWWSKSLMLMPAKRTSMPFLPDVVEQFECNRHEDVLIVGRMRQPALCRTPAAIRILKLERYRGTRQPLTAQAAVPLTLPTAQSPPQYPHAQLNL